MNWFLLYFLIGFIVCVIDAVVEEKVEIIIVLIWPIVILGSIIDSGIWIKRKLFAQNRKTCFSCNMKNPEKAKFCRRCGQILDSRIR